MCCLSEDENQPCSQGSLSLRNLVPRSRYEIEICDHAKRKEKKSLFYSQFNNRNRRKIYLSFTVVRKKISRNQTRKKGKNSALAGNRTRVNCLEGSYAHHYTTNAHVTKSSNFNYKDSTFLLHALLLSRFWKPSWGVGNCVRNYSVCMRI